MKITCSKSNLVKGVSIVSKAVPSKTTMPILECILIDDGSTDRSADIVEKIASALGFEPYELLIFKNLEIFKVLGSILGVISPFFIGLVIAWLLDPAVTYLQKKNVKKPNGGKPGFVVYYTNYSLMASSHIEGIRCVNAEDSVFLERSYV